MADELFIGWDLSTTQLKGLAVKANLQVVHRANVDFDRDFGDKYGIEKGVLTNPAEGEIFMPTSMWLEAIDLVLERLLQSGLDASRVVGMAGAGMQHGTVFWSDAAAALLAGLDARKTLAEQLAGAFSHPYSPNWQDHSTQEQCEEFDAALGGPEQLARATGSRAHHVCCLKIFVDMQRFSGPQIMRFRQKHIQAYRKTARISLVSSFLASVFLGQFAPIDIGDVCGMNLWEIRKGVWNEDLLALAAGDEGAKELAERLGPVPEDGGGSLGTISAYFVQKYGFNPSCQVAPFTGDNPSTILALPLEASDAIVSLGTSTTFLMSTPVYRPDPAYHFMNHPTTAGLYMFMLCFKNGSLARERARDSANGAVSEARRKGKDWDEFNRLALAAPPLGQHKAGDAVKLGLFFPRPEIVPPAPAGQWTFLYRPDDKNPLEQVEPQDSTELSTSWADPHDTVRATVESQLLSCRLRAAQLLQPQGQLPPQPRRIYVVGGGAVNPAITQLVGAVLGGSEGVWRLDVGGDACALGSAYKAVWAQQRADGGDVKAFEQLIAERWDQDSLAEKVDEGYREGTFEKYGEAVRGLALAEEAVLKQVAAQKQMQKANGHT